MRLIKLFIVFLILTITSNQVLAQEKAKLGNPEWHQYALYTIFRIEKDPPEVGIRRNDGIVVTMLAGSKVYVVNDLKKLRLYSKLGFTLDNIPLEGENACYFYNEALTAFLEAEELFPLAQEWLKKNGHSVRDLKDFQMVWPANPKIDEKSGKTLFKVNPMKSVCNGNLKMVDEVLGYWSGSVAAVTYGYKDERSVVVHEYLHACGYQHGLCKGEDWTVFKDGDKRYTYK